MRNIKLLLEYDGTEYSGWQRQERDRTIQGVLEDAAFRLLQEKVNIIGAGRTDAGVHATGQVANFRCGTQLSLVDIGRGLNALLPEDIIVRSTEDVSEDFHARFGARERTYSYTITRTPTAIMRRYRWHVSYELEIDGMRWPPPLFLERTILLRFASRLRRSTMSAAMSVPRSGKKQVQCSGSPFERTGSCTGWSVRWSEQ